MLLRTHQHVPADMCLLTLAYQTEPPQDPAIIKAPQSRGINREQDDVPKINDSSEAGAER
jgi:hypothetical protein